jgi:leucyl-tRNA synthetase
MEQYDPKQIEEKWQKYWDEKGIYSFASNSQKQKFYGLVEFPYPSGDGLHTGHVRGYTAMDIIARKRRAEGFDVLYPIGWDAFGLPTENYAIKTGKNPNEVTKTNSDNFRKQMKSLGFSFDWAREINTTDPKYYKWTQWLFLQFLKHDLAYKAKAVINWCPKDKIGLANEEVVNGCCERCGTAVEKREKEQWMLAITKYAERLDKDLDMVNYQEKIKLQQRNWIGKSEGAEVSFKLKVLSEEVQSKEIKVFTTRPDTIFGATYVVLAPEHPLLKNNELGIENNDEVQEYILTASKKEEFDRTDAGKEKTGVMLKGVNAINPATKEEIPVWVADYVLGGYGTGAVMAVPAHDERDFAFAKAYSLPIRTVITPEPVLSVMRNAEDIASGSNDSLTPVAECWTLPGILTNSGAFSGKKSEDITKEITEFAGGKLVTKFKLRDWVFSRQRYWGEPIPVIHCAKCGLVPVPEKDLPVLLPEVDHYVPTENGESPLATIDSWVNVECPTCGGGAKRETDVMPNWAGSSWYFLRYCDPHNDEEFASLGELKKLMPVDWYNGGMEHTTLHLLYSRFWNKFLFDIGLVSTSEPYQKRTSHGLILAEGGEKMSKSKGNVVNPDEVVRLYGTDTLRVYEMFMGPFSEPVAWSTESIIGPRRFLDRIWKLGNKVAKAENSTEDAEVESLLQKTVQKVSDDIESMSFNTVVSSLMVLQNAFEKAEAVSKRQYSIFLQLLAPLAPHITEELWSVLGNPDSITFAAWPIADMSKISQQKLQYIIQVNGKTRATLDSDVNEEEKSLVLKAQNLPEMKKWLEEGEIKRVIFVKNRLINFVV